jgi:hypothetical protein
VLLRLLWKIIHYIFEVLIIVVENATLDIHTGRFTIFSVITNIYIKKTKGPTLMELFTATGKLKKFF